MGAREVFETLDSALFGPSSPELEAISVEEQWARHQLNPHTDVFSDWKVYLVESADTARLLYRFKTGEIEEYVLTPGECDQVLETACKELGAIYDEEVARTR